MSDIIRLSRVLAGAPAAGGFSFPALWSFPNAAADLYFATGQYWNGVATLTDPSQFLSCSRASVGTAIDAQGVVKSFGSNVLRITTQGLLIEGVRTNRVLQSQGNFNNASFWTNSGASNIASVADNALTAPDGTTTASTVTEGNGNTTHEIRPTAAITTDSAGNFANSVFLKAGTQRYVAVTHASASSPTDYVTTVFDLVAGVTGETEQGNGTSFEYFSFMRPLTNGWFRCTIISNIAPTDATIRIGGAAAASGNTFATNGLPTYTGTGLTWHIWGAQEEDADPIFPGNAYPTSYIPTTTGAVTRENDNIQSSGGGNAGLVDTLWRASAGSAFAHFSHNTINNPDESLLTDANEVAAFMTVAEVFFTRDDDANSAETANNISENVLQKAAVSWDESVNLAAVLNGGTVATAVGTALANAAPINVGNDPSGFGTPLDGYLARLALWNFKLQDTVLQALTA